MNHIRKVKLTHNDNKRYKILNIKTNTPNTFEQAINSTDAEEWKITINNELSNMYNNGVMEIVNKFQKILMSLTRIGYLLKKIKTKRKQD